MKRYKIMVEWFGDDDQELENLEYEIALLMQGMDYDMWSYAEENPPDE